MAPSIDEYVSPGPSRGHGAGDDRDGSTTEVIMAERMAENEHRKRESMQMLPQMMHGLSFNVFGVEKLRAEQMVALQRCADPQFNDSKLLLVTRTGSGKSHVTRTLGVMMNGITVIFVPLLSLSADWSSR